MLVTCATGYDGSASAPQLRIMHVQGFCAEHVLLQAVQDLRMWYTGSVTTKSPPSASPSQYGIAHTCVMHAILCSRTSSSRLASLQNRKSAIQKL